MSNDKVSTHTPVLAIAPSTKGFGFAVFEEQGTLVDWGLKTVKGNKNHECLRKVKDLIRHYTPDVLVLQDVLAKNSKRWTRIRILVQEILDFAPVISVNVALLSMQQVSMALDGGYESTKNDVASLVAERFPELRPRLPNKRKLWGSEDSRMAIFDAVALGLAFQLKTEKSFESR